jgi:protein MAK11
MGSQTEAERRSHSRRRVKSVDFLLAKRPNPYSAIPIVVTVSSDGKMNVYNALSIFTSSVEEEIAPIASYDTQGSRLVCVRVAEVTRKVPQAKQEILGVKVESVKKEEEGNGLRFKGDDNDDDDEESGADEGDAAHDQEEEEEDEEEYEMEED